MSDIKMKPGHPEKFFHPVLGMVDASKGIKASQAKVLEAEGRLAASTKVASAKEKEEKKVS